MATILSKIGNFHKPFRLTGENTRLVVCCEVLLLILAFEFSLWTNHKRVAPVHLRAISTIILVTVVCGIILRQQRSLSTRITWADFNGTVSNTGWLTLAAGTFAPILVILGLGWCFGTLGNVRDYPKWLLRNGHVEVLQQVLLQLVLFPRILRLTESPGVAILGSATLFSLLHLPNPVLVMVTFPAACFWIRCYQAHRNLFAVAFSHFLLAATLLYSLNGSWLANLRVGAGYLVWRGV